MKAKKVLVFDLGGGTFDVSLLAIDKGEFRVLATSGDTHLGGSDFDQKIIEYFVDRFELKNELDLRKSPTAMAKLRREAEKAKRLLSSETSVRIDVEGIMDGIDLSETLTRAKFEELNKELFKKTIDPIKKVLQDTDTRPMEVCYPAPSGAQGWSWGAGLGCGVRVTVCGSVLAEMVLACTCVPQPQIPQHLSRNTPVPPCSLLLHSAPLQCLPTED